MPRKLSVFDTFLVAVGDRIRLLRNQRGYTLEQMGVSIGLDKSNMFRIEQGRNITLVTLLKVAAVLEVSPAELIDNEINVVQEDAEAFITRKKRRRRAV